MEIERKFHVRELPPELLSHPKAAIAQGYMAIEEQGAEVRLRNMAGTCYLTIKSKGNLARKEAEIVLSQEQFELLWPFTEGRRVIKDRYLIPYRDFQIELDVFKDKLEGLIVAEVEFPSLEAAEAFEKTAWMGTDLTNNPKLKNRVLCTLESIADLNIVL